MINSTKRFVSGHNNCEAVIQMSLKGKFIKEWISAKQASVSIGLPSGCIRNCCKGIQKLAGGFKWKYKE